MKRLTTILGYLILTGAICINLWLYYPETQILADPNDNIFQYSLIQRTDWIWQNYGCPLSPACLPNLTDHVVTAWAEGYPLPVYYPHIPQITIVSSYRLLAKPITGFFHHNFSLYEYYNLTKYLLLCLFPVFVFLALKVVGFNPLSAALTAFFASNFSTDGLYGIDPPSFLWRGYGLTSQLYAMVFFPLSIAFIHKSMANSARERIFSKESILAAIFLILTISGHLGIGIIGLISTVPFIFLDARKHSLGLRIKKMMVIYILVFAALSYWIIPILLTNNYHIISFWDPIWKFNSYGWKEVVKQFLQGEIFDFARPYPLITLLVFIGFFVLCFNSNLFPFALLFLMWTLFYFGRTTWNGLLDLIPGMKDFHQHRFIVGIQMAALFLIPAGIDYILWLIQRISRLVIQLENLKCKMQNVKLQLKIKNLLVSFVKHDKIFADRIGNHVLTMSVSDNKHNKTSDDNTTHYKNLISCEQENFISEQSNSSLKNIIFYLIFFVLISTLGYFTIQQTISYAKLNNEWIKQANSAYRYDYQNFKNLTAYLDNLPQARVYAGRPGNWGHDFRLGSSQMYMLMAIAGFDVSQFLPETWSPMSENEQNFDERLFSDYDLLNLHYIVSPKNQDFPKEAKLLNSFGPFELREVPTNGWFDVISAPMKVVTDKTNFINIVHLWHRSYARFWKMHPVIDVQNTFKSIGKIDREIKMIDEVNYKEGNEVKNIFSDFPFIFPEATPSSQILKEEVSKQTYKAEIKVGQNCDSCLAIFKMSFHPDWQAKVDGKPTEKVAVFPFYLAVPVTPGVHTIEFTYQPGKIKVILLFGELIIVTCLVFLFIKKSDQNRITI